MDEMKYIIFQLGQQKYGMNLSYVQGIEQDYQVIPVPNAPECIDGIVNLRGVVIPVYSIKKRFRMKETEKNNKKNLLVTVNSDSMIAYEIDQVLGIEQLDSAHLVKMPDVASNNETTFLKRVLKLKDEIVIAIDVETILSKEKKDEINAFVEKQQDKE